ncbi:MAG TPA: hypothetical protein VN711_04710 [Candidatus Saccharimonadales bacterium]|nr:hypothetical protein [Candidatus Saccharimonadales bacterium]
MDQAPTIQLPNPPTEQKKKGSSFLFAPSMSPSNNVGYRHGDRFFIVIPSPTSRRMDQFTFPTIAFVIPLVAFSSLEPEIK